MAELIYTDDLIRIVERAKEECLLTDNADAPFVVAANHGTKVMASTILMLAARHDYELKYGEPYDNEGKSRMAPKP